MMKRFFIFILAFLYLEANESSLLQNQNVLTVQNLIELEENIAKAYEKYLLNEFAIPTIEKLKHKDYLGENYDFKNIFGDDIDFKSANDRQIKFAIKKDQYHNSENNYVLEFYKRGLYRDFTSPYLAKDSNKFDFTNSYVEINLKSKEAQNIYYILTQEKKTIVKKAINEKCSSSENGKFCVEDKNLNIIKFMVQDNFIGYNLKDFENGDVVLSDVSSDFLDLSKSDNRLRNLKIGAYIFGQEKKYIRLHGENSDSIRLVK